MFVRLAVAVVMLRLSLSAGTQSLADVDFKNFDYPWPQSAVDQGVPSGWHWLEATPRSHVRLNDGWHRFNPTDPSDGGYLHLTSVTHGDLDGDGRDEAVVDLLYGSGGTANWHYVYVFSAVDGNVASLGILESGSRAWGGLVNVQIARGVLVLDFLDADRRVAECCSRGVIRVRYRLKDGRFVDAREREKESVRDVDYAPLPTTGAQTVEQRLEGKAVNIVYSGVDGVEKTLTSSGINTEPNLSSDKRSVVFLREVDDRQREIWVVRTDGSGASPLYREPVHWNGEPCPSSSFRSPQWSVDGHAVFFVSDCTLMTGALWRLEIESRSVKAIIPDAVNYGVIQTGRFRGFLIADQRSLPARDAPSANRYPVYLFFLYTPQGKRVRQVGEEGESLAELLREWEGL